MRVSTILATGFAMFAMFFGAGNIVFPLALGQAAQNQNFWGAIGMAITAVLVPLAGLIAMLLHEGDYQKFFRSIGKFPGFLLSSMILCLIGPFAGIPRCITIAHSTVVSSGLFPNINLLLFSVSTCLLIFLFTFRPTKILGLIGKVLTPILLISLAVIVVKGLFVMPHAAISDHTRVKTFFSGFIQGYNTMDLLASFFFSSVVLVCLRSEKKADSKSMMRAAVIGSGIASALLMAVYFSFSFLAAGYSSKLASVAGQEMLGTLACELLGPYAGLVVAVLVCFAVLTTMIALTAIFAEFLHETVFRKKISYITSLFATLAVSFAVSTLHFDGIATFLGPVLQVCYPALIGLAILGIIHKIYGFKHVKPCFYGILGATTLFKILSLSLG